MSKINVVNLRGAVALALGAVVTAAPVLWAAPALGAVANGVLEEVVVTATKREQRLMDVPSSIVAESGAELEHRGAIQLQDIVDNTPGLSNPSPGSSNQANLVIRGVTTGTSFGLKQATVALLYDDIPIDPGAQAGGTTNLRVVDIHSVEVLRGPQGTLYGSGSLSGAVRYVTNKPDLTKFEGAAEATLANTETGAVSYNGSVMLNAPIVNDVAALRGVAYYYNDAGWITNLQNGQQNINSNSTYGGRLMLTVRPSERFQIGASLMYQNSTDHANASMLYVQPAGYGNKLVTDGIFEPNNNNKTIIGNVSLQYDFDNFSVLSTSTYHDRKGISYGDDYYFVPLVTAIVTGFEGTAYGADQGLYFVNAKNYSEELRFSSRGAGKLKWTAGVYYFNSQLDSSQENHSALTIPFIGSDNIVDLIASEKQKEMAVFGELTYTLAEKWDFTAGLRYSHTTLDSHVDTGGFIPIFSIDPADYAHEDFHENDKPVTPRLAIDYRLRPDLSLYAAAARGFRIGGLNETSGVGGRASPKIYGPDDLWNYEIGVKGRALDGRLAYSADVYSINWNNIQVDLQNNFGNYTGNAGKARLYGFEGQLDSHPIDWFEYGASVTFSDNRISQGVTGLSTALGVIDVNKGDQLPASPTSQAAAYGQVAVKAGDHPAYVRASGHYIGPQYTAFANTGSKFGDYMNFDLRVGVHLEQFEVVAFVNNVLNTIGKTSAADTSTVGPLVLFNQMAWTTRPRTVGITLRTKF